MAREIKDEVHLRANEKYDVIRRYEMFGWKLDVSEKYTDYLGMSEAKGIFFDLCFSRDKDAPWYKRVCELEKEYNDICKNDYEDIKIKYNYEEKSKIGQKPITPKLAQPQKFFRGTLVLILGILILLFEASKEGELGDLNKILTEIGAVVTGIGAIVLLFKIKYLKGLKGKKKKKALNATAKYKEDVAKFIASRKREIEDELKIIFKY